MSTFSQPPAYSTRCVKPFGCGISVCAPNRRMCIGLNPDCPLAILSKPGNDGWSRCIGPEAREPCAFSAGYGQHQFALTGIVRQPHGELRPKPGNSRCPNLSVWLGVGVRAITASTAPLLRMEESFPIGIDPIMSNAIDTGKPWSDPVFLRRFT